jgi:hypothetical protein
MLHVALLVILHFDKAQENRALSCNEIHLRASLKTKAIALSVVERARKKQCARIANIKKGDANTKFFHMRVNARRRKNHVQWLKHNHGWVTEHNAKEEIVSNHFNSIIGTRAARPHDFNWDELNFPSVDMLSLGNPFTEAEVKSAIDQMPIDKAPSPDGYTGLFSRSVGTSSRMIL